MHSSNTRLYIVLALALLISRLLASRVLLVYDDAYITFTYARNLAEGHGFVYYPGDGVLGTTAPLFGVLSALFYLLRLPMPVSAVVTNALLDVVVFGLIVTALPGERRRVGALAFAVLFAVSPIVARVCVGAMETSLYLAASVAAILLFLRGRRGPAFAIAALSYFLRPEAILLLIILGIEQIRTGPAARTARLAALSVACIALPLLLIFLVYGQVLPQSVVAKSGDGSALAVVLRQFLAPDPMQAALLIPAVWGAVTAVRYRWRFGIMVGLWGLLYVAAYAIARPHVWSWYGVPVYAAVLLLAGHGLADLARRVRLEPMLSRAAAVLAVIPILVWLGAVVRLGPESKWGASRHRIETWCGEHITDPTTTIAASDIGVIGYFSRARIIDLHGLVWPGATAYDSWRDIVKGEAPDYLFFNATRTTVDMLADPEIGSRYRPVARFSDHPDAPLDLTPENVSGRWAPDYVVYQRIPGPGP